MSQKTRRSLYIYPIGQHQRGERMTGGMPSNMLINTGPFNPVTEDLQTHRIARKIENQLICSRTNPDKRQQTLVQRNLDMTVRTAAFRFQRLEKQQFISIIDIAETKLADIAITNTRIQRKNECPANLRIQPRIIRRQQLLDLFSTENLFPKGVGIDFTNNVQAWIFGQNILVNSSFNHLFEMLKNRMRPFFLKFALQVGHKLSDHILGDLLRFDRMAKKRIFFTQELLKLNLRTGNMNYIGFRIIRNIDLEPIEEILIASRFQLIAPYRLT